VMSRISRALLAVMVVLLAAAHVWTQATAQINGTVADSSGAVLPGVTRNRHPDGDRLSVARR